MAGSDELHDSTRNLEHVSAPASGGTKSGAHKIRSFVCKNCGHSVSLRNPGQSVTVVCQSCQSVIDANDENYNILQRYNKATSPFSPTIPLGSRGELFGKKWEVIGYIVRQESSSHFFWDEYLLFNPYYGYRWLTQIKGHWTFVRTIKDTPRCDMGSSYHAYYNNRRFRIFDRGEVTVVYVLGEFYWNVSTSVQHNVFAEDYVDPPFMLSGERSQKEVIWSIGEYITPREVQKAFKLRSGLIEILPFGIAANQPSGNTKTFNGVLPWWILSFILLTVLQIFQMAQPGQNQVALADSISFVPNAKSTSYTTKVFELRRPHGNLELQFNAPVDNSWLYVSGELVNNATGTTYPFERSIEQYSGYDGGEYWSEGGTSSNLLMSSIPAGKYYLNLDYESGMFKDNNTRAFGVTAVGGAVSFSNYMWSLFFISALPLFVWLLSYQDEVKRWSNSDFSPYPSSE